MDRFVPSSREVSRFSLNRWRLFFNSFLTSHFRLKQRRVVGKLYELEAAALFCKHRTHSAAAAGHSATITALSKDCPGHHLK